MKSARKFLCVAGCSVAISMCQSQETTESNVSTVEINLGSDLAEDYPSKGLEVFRINPHQYR